MSIAVSAPVRARADAARMTSRRTPPTPPTPPTPASCTAAPVDARFLYTRLQREWDRLATSAAALERARSWDLPCGELRTLDDLLRHAGYGQLGDRRADEDALLARLVRLARHDDLAARVTLQRLMPGLCAMSRQRARMRDRHAAEVCADDDEILGTAWTVLRNYSPDRRTDYVAARLLKEVEYRVYRLPRRRLATFVPVPTTDLDTAIDEEPLAEPARLLDVILRDAARRGLDEDDLRTLRHWATGVEASAIAEAEQVTERTVRNHRNAALRRLRRVVGSAAA